MDDVRFGYTLFTEQSGPRQLVDYAGRAEAAGFDFEVMSDHYFPWLSEQGHAAYAWSVLGAVTQVTEQVELMTYVTCPTMRYHPAVVAQKAATMGILSDNRFTLGLGAGENLNEHVAGHRWPRVAERHDMLVEALEIIARLLDGEMVDHIGEHFQVDAARLWDLPDQRVPIGVAVSGPRSVQAFAPLADSMIAVQPETELVQQWDDAHSGASRKIGQLPICWGRDTDAAIERAHALMRWFGGGWSVNAELPTPAAFDAATAYVRPEDVAASIPCGPEVGPIVEALDGFRQAGFTDIAVVQIGDESQQDFLGFAQDELLPALRQPY